MHKDERPLLKNTKFLYLWVSQILSQLTIYIMNFLLLLKLFEETGSTIATSLLWVSYALPTILVGPFAAASVDMIDRRRILVATNLLQSASIFLYALTHSLSLFLLYGVALTYSLLNQFYVPAELAALPTILPKTQLARANGLFFITLQVAVVSGFGLAGILSSVYGFTKTLYFCSALLFAAFVSVSFLPKMTTGAKVPKKFEKMFSKFFKTIVEGYRYIKDNNYILAPLVLLLALHVSLLVVVINFPILATQILQIDVNLAGVLITVPAGIGAGIGAIFIPRILARRWRKIRVIEISFMLITLVIFALSLVVPEISGVKRVFLGIITIFLAGVAFVGILVPIQTFLQETIPVGLRGRVFGNYWFLTTIASVFPVVFSGTLTELFGIRVLMLLLSAVSLAGLIFVKNYGHEFVRAGFSFGKRE